MKTEKVETPSETADFSFLILHESPSFSLVNWLRAKSSAFWSSSGVLHKISTPPTQPVGLELDCKGLRIVASGQGLDLDASGFGIVQNENFLDRLPRIGDHAQHLRNLIKSQLKRCCRPLSEVYESGQDARVQNYRRLIEGAFG